MNLSTDYRALTKLLVLKIGIKKGTQFEHLSYEKNIT